MSSKICLNGLGTGYLKDESLMLQPYRTLFEYHNKSTLLFILTLKIATSAAPKFKNLVIIKNAPPDQTLAQNPRIVKTQNLNPTPCFVSTKTNKNKRGKKPVTCLLDLIFCIETPNVNPNPKLQNWTQKTGEE